MYNTFKDILKGKVVIVGIGNAMKSDDGLGPSLIERLKGRTQARCIDTGTAPENYTGKIAKENPDTILLVDAVDLGLQPGKFRILKAGDILKTGFTTHDISPRMFIDYMGSRTNAEIYLLGVQPENISFGSDLSENVKNALDKLAQLIQEIKNA